MARLEATDPNLPSLREGPVEFGTLPGLDSYSSSRRCAMLSIVGSVLVVRARPRHRLSMALEFVGAAENELVANQPPIDDQSSARL